MLWIAALLSLIIWAIGWQSGFLGPVVHIFLLLSLLALIIAMLPGRAMADDDGTDGVRSEPPRE